MSELLRMPDVHGSDSYMKIHLVDPRKENYLLSISIWCFFCLRCFLSNHSDGISNIITALLFTQRFEIVRSKRKCFHLALLPEIPDTQH